MEEEIERLQSMIIGNSKETVSLVHNMTNIYNIIYNEFTETVTSCCIPT